MDSLTASQLRSADAKSRAVDALCVYADTYRKINRSDARTVSGRWLVSLSARQIIEEARAAVIRDLSKFTEDLAMCGRTDDVKTAGQLLVNVAVLGLEMAGQDYMDRAVQTVKELG